jgi:hypothetical protein
MTVESTKKLRKLVRANLKQARLRWPSTLDKGTLELLRSYTEQYNFSLSSGDLLLLERGWYVTHSGLVRPARRKKCCGIHVETIESLCEPSSSRFVLKATVHPSKSSAGFVGYGDADPSNVSPLVRGAEMRVAETRAVNRALRKAYGIGICSIEEIGSSAESQSSQEAKKIPPQPANGNYGGAKVRDRLCQIIRQHQLDATLVKSYATDFCGVKSLREATREQVEHFVEELANWAEKDRNALICQLNSYLPRGENKEGAA